MHDRPISRLIIIGGGTAGWMAASMTAKVMGTQNLTITLVESADIGTVGVGEATVPPIQTFNRMLGIDEDEFIAATEGTFKLGIRFDDWKSAGSSYFHPFGTIGQDSGPIPFIHYWLRNMSLGGNPDFGLHNAETMAARADKFGRTMGPERRAVNYAFHFDALKYAAYLRKYAEARGVTRLEGKVVKVSQDALSGFVTSVTTADGRVVEGDMFLDCSGFRGLLIEETLHAGYEDWSQWLPCNSAVAVPCEKTADPATGKPLPIEPYVVCTAREAGWQWHIPLQHRTGNGYVFCSDFSSDEEATTRIMSRLGGKPLQDPKVLKFTSGHRKKMWDKNVLSLGLASGFLEPLESTSIHLTHAAIIKFLGLFPKNGCHDSVIAQFNEDILAQYVNVKDFLIAHYKVTEREDTPFWKYCKHMDIPDSLAQRIDIFRRTGQPYTQIGELFREASWIAVLIGQGLMPQAYHPAVDNLSEDELRLTINDSLRRAQADVKSLPLQDDFLKSLRGATAG